MVSRYPLGASVLCARAPSAALRTNAVAIPTVMTPRRAGRTARSLRLRSGHRDWGEARTSRGARKQTIAVGLRRRGLVRADVGASQLWKDGRVFAGGRD